MAIRQAIWKVGSTPSALQPANLPTERLLEDMIVSAPAILDDQWMLIGRQVSTKFAGFIDLLALAPDGSLVLIELKRDKTPREVVAQALDYASFVADLKSEDVASIYEAFAPDKDLNTEFKNRFGVDLDEEVLNGSHQIVVVAAQLDDSTERIVSYLGDRGIPINVLFFQVFTDGETQYLSRAWLRDTAETQANAVAAAPGVKEPWNGEFYVNYGQSPSGRSWPEAVKYGFVSAGGDPWYSGPLKRLSVGDRIWVKAPSHGFVGVARVAETAVRANEFKLPTTEGERPALEVLKGTYHNDVADDPDKSEYFVKVHWLDTVPLEKAVREVGLFGNQNTVAQPASPKWRHTVDRLKQVFTNWDAPNR
jgi:hypothetical protein